ncbi:MAG: hypothetical protein ACFFD6_11730, partial [Candidatus Thorarchaeota archaeon]
SFGILGASFLYGTAIPLLTTVFAAIGVLVYSIIAFYSLRWSGHSLQETSFGGVEVDEKPSDIIEFNPTRPLAGIIRKDLRLGSRSMSAIMIFAIPLLMALFVYPFLTMSPEGVIRSTNILIALGYSQTFLGFSLIGLLSIDAQGASVFDGLPLRPVLNLQAKVIIFLVCEVLAMLVITVLLAINPIIVPLLIVMPICQIPCGYAFAMTIGSVIYLRKGGGSVVAINLASEQVLVILSVAMGAIVGILPLIGYSVALVSTGTHLIGVGVQLAISIIESLAIWGIAPRLLQK